MRPARRLSLAPPSVIGRLAGRRDGELAVRSKRISSQPRQNLLVVIGRLDVIPHGQMAPEAGRAYFTGIQNEVLKSRMFVPVSVIDPSRSRTPMRDPIGSRL